MTDVDERPTHIIETASDDRTRCGIKIMTKAALPFVGARFVRAHIEGRVRAQRPPMVWCPECWEEVDDARATAAGSAEPDAAAAP